MISNRIDTTNIIEFTNGNAKAFKAIYDRFSPPIFYFIKELVKDETIASDIVSETFVKLWQLREGFTSNQRIFAFLKITAHHSCLDYFRHAKRKDERHKEILYLLKSEQAESLWAWIDHKTEILQEILEELEKLAPRTREIMVLAFKEGLTTQEIAIQLGLSNSTVKNTKANGVKQLRFLMNEKNQMFTISFFILCVSLQDYLT
jgi:RNA polymerase sigma factor (sigma-70 family)